MFGFLKRKQDEHKAPASPPQFQPPGMSDAVTISTMPAKFLAVDQPRFWTAGKLWTLVAVVMLGLVGGVYWLLTSPRFAPHPAAAPVAKAPASNAPAPASAPANAPLLPLENVATNTERANTNASTAPPPSTPSPAAETPTPTTPTATPAPKAPSAILSASPDTDGDGLTDVEEALWQTDPKKADTDGDGYPDGVELQNGYNPTGPGKLAGSKLVKTYSSALYTALYPQAWTLTQSTDGSEAQFVASPDEFVSVSVQPNSNALSLGDWYASVVPGTNVASLSVETVRHNRGLFSPDRRTFYFIPPERPNDVIVVNDNVGTKKVLDYPMTFLTIIANLTPTPPTP